MPTKKAAKKKAATKKKATEKATPRRKKKSQKRVKPREMRLVGEQFWKWRAGMLQVSERRIAAEKAARELEFERTKTVYATLVKLENTSLMALEAYRSAKAEFAQLQGEIAEDFGISLASLLSHEFTINEDNGVIHFHQSKG